LGTFDYADIMPIITLNYADYYADKTALCRLLCRLSSKMTIDSLFKIITIYSHFKEKLLKFRKKLTWKALASSDGTSALSIATGSLEAHSAARR